MTLFDAGVPRPSHAPAGYHCPFCFLVAGGETEVDSPRDVVVRTGLATAFVAAFWWPRNPAHVIVIPDAHHENLYELPAADGHAVHDVVRAVAIGMRAAYRCDGITVRQHNEPAGGQEVWHHHVHVIPRYAGDGFGRSVPGTAVVPVAEREAHAVLLRRAIEPRAPGQTMYRVQ